MNRSVDSRSDLYSLGVTLYQMLTGRLPFTASDPMEWVHCHIAMQPPPLSQRRADIPAPLSDIVMKLLAKNAEDRYQTAEGLKADLERCAAEWRAQGRMAPFPLGARDIPDRLLIPEKLYGREREVETLLAAFGRVVARRQAGTRARLRLFGRRQIRTGERAAQGARSAARPFCFGQVRPVQARHSLCHLGASLQHSLFIRSWARAKLELEELAPGPERGAGPQWAAHRGPGPGAEAHHRRTACRPGT